MPVSRKNQSGFTLIEISIVFLIVTILLGYTVALFPIQRELKQYRLVDQELDDIVTTIIGFAQVNGRLPCPAIPNSVGVEAGGGATDCTSFAGFVPVNTIGVEGRLNRDMLMLDPWGNPYRYYVSNSNFNAAGGADFVRSGEMQAIGLIDLNSDDYIDLDGEFHICDVPDNTSDDICETIGGIYQVVFGRETATGGPYAGAPFVLVSQGKDWNEIAAVGDQLVNQGTSQSLTDLLLPNGPLGVQYTLKNVVGGETVFVKRISGFADDFDDVVKWVSPNLLFSKMIEAGKLP